VEIEGKGLDSEGLGRIADVLQEGGAGEAPQIPKLVRALGRRATAPPEVVVPDALPATADAGEAVRAAIARSVERIMLNDPGTRLGEVEPLHQMRVGARRLRSDLKTFRALVERAWADNLREELRWLGQVLGDVRDLDVMIDRLRSDAGDLAGALGPLFDALETRRRQARATLLKALRTARYLELLDHLVEAATSPVLTDAADQPARTALPPMVRRAWKKVRKQGERLDASSGDEEYHRVRVLTKRARYGADAVAPALSRKRAARAKKFAHKAADVQDVLGALQDSVIARETIEEVARAHPEAGAFNLAAGRLIERELAVRVRNRERFPSAWNRLDRKRRTNWM
jgi:CHAD domain-containing protein